MLHHIQKHILDTLATSPAARYSDLKPEHLDGNTFTYHLKRLITDKYVTQRSGEGTYELTQRGKTYIVHRYENPLQQAHTIFLVVIKSHESWLMRKRLVHPHLHKVGFIHGEPRYDEPVTQTAARRLYDKTGLSVTLEVRGSALISIMNGDELESYSHAVLLYGETSDDIRIHSDQTGENFFATTQEIAQLDVLPSVHDILASIDQSCSHLELHYPA